MGPLGDEENRNDNEAKKNDLNVDSSIAETQKIDSQFSPDILGGDFRGDEIDDSLYHTNTIPFNDTCLLEDSFETQFLNLAGETQVLEDLDYVKNICPDFLDVSDSEVADDSDSEGTNNTQILCDTQQLSQEEDTMEMNGGDLVGEEETMDIPLSRKDVNVSGPPLVKFGIKERHPGDSGPFSREFTSIRVASIRASGLAAQARKNNENSEEVEKSNKRNSASVRELFPEDKITENVNMPESPSSVTVLDYAYSGEPSELSQARALEVVDRFLELNAMDINQVLDSTKTHVAREPMISSGAKGSLELAKSMSTLKSREQFGVFDLDDGDGEGEFFLKNKELFFDSKKPRKLNLKSTGKEEKINTKKKVNLTPVLHKNLSKDFDDAVNVDIVPDSKDIGPDTQLAAEAMETLCFKVNLDKTDSKSSDKGSTHSTKKATKRKRSSKISAHSEQSLSSSVGVVTRQSRQKLKLDSSSAPVAHRTRRSGESNRSVDSFDLISARVVRKRRTPSKPESGTSVKKARSAGVNRSNPKGVSTSDNAKSNLNDVVEARTPPPSCTVPAARCTTPINNASPICMGDEYHRQSCRKNTAKFSLIQEINGLLTCPPGPVSGAEDSRKRRDITNVSVLFSQHLDVDVVKRQKKILSRLGASVASCMSDATHFVADEFVRTRNMLEAIALGKPVVTHLWLKSCGQTSSFLNEKNYILRDSKKEKEFSFSMSVSLSRACQNPLLQGQKVWVTPNTKPGKEILCNLVKAVHGLAVERLGRSVLNDDKLPDNLLILSCEEDYELCVPFLEKGGTVYSSELLLNGIVRQNLEFERHRLFADHVKRTRSTIWVKSKNKYHPVTRSK